LQGRIAAVFGNLVIAETTDRVVQNSVGYCVRGDGTRMLSEVVRVRNRMADLQVFEETRGLKVGDTVEFEKQMLSTTLGPGLLGQIYDGLQNPLPQLAEKIGFFLEPGNYLHALDLEKKWDFTPGVEVGAKVEAGAFHVEGASVGRKDRAGRFLHGRSRNRRVEGRRRRDPLGDDAAGLARQAAA
jgi:V/A-type H+-transporting ATPase subunit A